MSGLHTKASVKATVLSSHFKKEQKIVMPAEDKKLENNNENNSNKNNNNNNNTNESINNNDDEKDKTAKEILENFHKIISSEDGLNNAAEYLLNALVDDSCFGVLLEMHQLAKTGNLTAIEGVPENPEYLPTNDKNNKTNSTVAAHSDSMIINSNSSSSANANTSGGNTPSPSITQQLNRALHASTSSESKCAQKVPSKYALKVNKPNYDIFGVKLAKKPMDCTCPNCDRLVSAARFAPHLEKCMGMGRLSSRIASRRLATKETNNINTPALTTTELFGTSNNVTLSKNYINSNNAIATDEDEDDVDWSSTTEKRRKKTHGNSRNNGSKRNHSNQKF